MIFEYTYTWSDFVGNIGVILIIVAFYLNVSEKLTSNNLRYHMMNFFGAFFLLISLFFKPNLSNIMIEIIWLGISSYGILKNLHKKY